MLEPPQQHRKLSASSTASSNPSQYSSASVLIRPGEGMSSNVLQSIKDSEANRDFDPNHLFAETHRKRKKAKEPLLPGTFLNSAFASETSFASDTSSEEVMTSGDDASFYDQYDDLNGFEEDDADDTETEDIDEEPLSPTIEVEHYGLTDDLDLLPPSPPRSPPLDIDPEKLYGLYEFAGPDPLHCTLARDEPVSLLNDQDDYWWLVRKLTKRERLVLRNKRNKMADPDCPSDTESMLSDHEDEGKVGFVPAECLETYGERLARLNCFKNEELEKFADPLTEEGLAISSEIRRHLDDSDTSNTPPDGDVTNPISVESHDLFDTSAVNTSTYSGTSLGRVSSLRQNGPRPRNKSVTFQAQPLLDLDEDGAEADREFADHYATTITKDELAKYQQPPEDEKRSEIMSDIYPEAPLMVNKSRRDRPTTGANGNGMDNVTTKDKDSGIDGTINDEESKPAIVEPAKRNERATLGDDIYPEPLDEFREIRQGSQHPKPVQYTHQSIDQRVKSDFRPPNPYRSQADSTSIGSFSPDTPQADHGRFDDDNLVTFSRSVIIDRLNQVTNDIEGLDFDDDYGYYDKLDEDDDLGHRGSIDSVGRRDNDENASTTPLTSVNLFSNSISNSLTTSGTSGQVPYTEPVTKRKSESVTARNIETYRTLSESGRSTGNEKRKSRAVHEMFVPILGRFDELAERLAELEKMI